MVLNENDLYNAMQKAREDYNRARRELAEYNAEFERELFRRAERVDDLHRQYKTTWTAWMEGKHRAFIAELEAATDDE